MMGSVAGSVLGARLIERLGINKLLAYGATALAVFGVLEFALAVSGVAAVSAAAVVGPFILFKLFDSIVGAQATAGALSPFPTNAGMASSLIGFIRQSTGATMAVIVGAFSDGTTLIPMATGILIAGLMPVVTYLLFIRRKVPAS